MSETHTERRCPQCDRQAAVDARFCAGCGLKLDAGRGGTAAREGAPADDSPLRRIWQHPDLPLMFRHEPGHRGRMAGRELSILLWGFLLLVSALGGFFVLKQEYPLWMLAVPGVPLLVSIVMLLVIWRSIEAYHETELLRLPAEVVKVIVLDAPPADDPEHPGGVLTLEFDNRMKRAFRVDPELLTRLSPGDVGVAYVREGELLDYRRLRA